METKDLILLMLVPLLLVSIIFYTDNSGVIGAVTAKQEESNIIGSYSIAPSFKAKLDYDLQNNYNNIKNKIGIMIDECFKEPNAGQCLKDKRKDSNWECIESKDDATLILYDFIDKIEECLTIKEDGIVCRFNLDEREITSQINTFDIILTNQNLKTKIEVRQGTKSVEDFINLENLVYTVYDNRDTLSERLNPVNIILEYQGKKPVIKDVFGKDDSTNRIPLSKTFLLYKKDGDIKFVEAPGSSFEAPIPANKLVDLPRVDGVKFCAKTGKKIVAYDDIDGKAKEREIIFKFAVTFPNPPPPPPVKTLAAEDKLKSEKSIVLKWNKVKNEDGTDIADFDHYNIYCSRNSFIDKENQIILNSQPSMTIKSSINYDSWISDINMCGKEQIEENIDYYFAVTSVSKAGKESKAIVQASSRSIDDLGPGMSKIILINSDGAREEKLSSACISLPVEKENKAGNIWVGFFAPSRNEDEITDVKDEITYLLHYSKQTPTINLNECVRYKCMELGFAPKDKIDFAPERTFHKNREFESPNTFFAEGQTYCFTVVARDKNGNMIKSLPYKFAKPSQWLDLEAKPVIKGFFNDKGEVNYS